MVAILGSLRGKCGMEVHNPQYVLWIYHDSRAFSHSPQSPLLNYLLDGIAYNVLPCTRLRIGGPMKDRTEVLTPKQAYATVVNRAGMSRIKLSKALGKSDNYIQNSVAQGGVPNLELFARVAVLAGYEVIVRRGDEVIRINPVFEV